MASRAHARVPTRALAVLALAALVAAVTGPAAHADDPTTTTTTSTTAPSTAPASDPTPTPTTTTAPAPARPDAEAFAALADQVTRNQGLLNDLTAQVAQSTQRLTELATQITDTQQELDTTRAEIARLKEIVRTRASYIYQHAHTPDVAMVDIQHVEDITSGKKYAESATHTDGAKIDDLGHLSDTLDAHRKELDAELAAQQQEHDRLENARVALDALTAKQKKLLDQAGAIPVMGDAELTGQQITDWFASRNVHYRLVGGMSIGDLVQLYMEEGAAEHVRPELAFAQSIIETGSFGNALDSNYAGIGACDSCNGEPAFPTPRDGVRGQIQLLRNYADPTSRAANLANPPAATIYGSNPFTAAALYDSFFAKGRVPTWNVMGNGNWATDPGYAQKVLTVYFQMVSFAARH